MKLVVRRVITCKEDILIEGRRTLPEPLRIAVASAVLHNPLTGRYVDDLVPWRVTAASALGELLVENLARLTDEPIEAFGKGVLVGLNGEVEHGSVLIHTLEFGNHLRRLANGQSLVPSAEKRGQAGSTIDLAMKHVNDTTVRSHHMTYEFRVPDAPHADEILIAICAATGGRPHARSGTLADEKPLTTGS